MKNQELEQMLKIARLPEREESYWVRFPGQVMTKIQERAAGVRSLPRRHSLAPLFATLLGGLRLKPVFALALAGVCVGLGFVFGLWTANHSSENATQLAVVRKYYQELEALFPNQIRAVIFDAHGARLELAERADVPVSPPLFLRIGGPQGCQEFVTFSGQSIRIHGESCEVLLDQRGDVLLVGERSVWSSSEPRGKAGAYRVEAGPLYKTS
ncbi:MAG: hypothetical protein ACTHLW_15800 [Verrucomicrobiota bacterium]